MRHASNSRPLPLAYSPPPCSSLKAAWMRSMQSTDMRSKLENSARSSSSASCRCLVAAPPIALMKMLRKCPWQSPIQTPHLASRSLSLSASHASSPILSRPAARAAILTSRFALRAPLQVSLWSTAFSLSLCSPTVDGSGAPLPPSCRCRTAPRAPPSSPRAAPGCAQRARRPRRRCTPRSHLCGVGSESARE